MYQTCTVLYFFIVHIEEAGFWTNIFGFLLSVIIFAFIIILSGMFHLPHRLKNHPTQYKPPNETETTDWLNIIMARINTTHVDTELLTKVCNFLSEKIATWWISLHF